MESANGATSDSYYKQRSAQYFMSLQVLLFKNYKTKPGSPCMDSSDSFALLWNMLMGLQAVSITSKSLLNISGHRSLAGIRRRAHSSKVDITLP